MRHFSTSFFAYLFFGFFVFVVLALGVSLTSSTFSQLFSLFSQDGRIFDVFLYFSYFLGFGLCLYSLIALDRLQRGSFGVFVVILSLCLMFVFLVVFGLFGPQERISLLDLVLTKESPKDFKDVLSSHIGEFFVFGFFYIFFIFAPLLDDWSHFSARNSQRFRFLLKLKPSLNITIYALIGSSLQSFFHKGHWIFYLDLVALGVGGILLAMNIRIRSVRLGFFELCNLAFMVVGVIVFAFSSSVIHNAPFSARYVFLNLAFVAWCAEWMMRNLQEK